MAAQNGAHLLLDLLATLPGYTWTAELKLAWHLKEDLLQLIQNHVEEEAYAEPDCEALAYSYLEIASRKRKLTSMFERVYAASTVDYNEAMAELKKFRKRHEDLVEAEVSNLAELMIESNEKIAQQEEEVRKLEEARREMQVERSKYQASLKDFYKYHPTSRCGCYFYEEKYASLLELIEEVALLDRADFIPDFKLADSPSE